MQKETTANWFEVSREGLRELYKGKAHKFVLRELIQNAWDENIRRCEVTASWTEGSAVVRVEDDAPSGFRNLADAWTLFGTTYKRDLPEKRGRFNLGEKQVLAVADLCEISTTKGIVVFDDYGRTVSPPTRSRGSQVTVVLPMTRKHYEEMVTDVEKYLPPGTIRFTVNGQRIKAPGPVQTFRVSLVTEVKEEGTLHRRTRDADISLYPPLNGEAYLYEIGIPVETIECDYSIDVFQKVPLAPDRESVPVWYLRDLYAVVLNTVSRDLVPEQASETWVRDAMESKRVEPETVRAVLTKRFGDKFCVANPNDPQSIDEAIARGYKVIQGPEMSAAEWEKAKMLVGVSSSTTLFGATFVDSELVRDPTDYLQRFASYAKFLGKALLGIDIQVQFYRSPGATCTAQFGGLVLGVNVSRLSVEFFNDLEAMTDLVLHELGHHVGRHTDHAYHKTLTRMGAKLLIMALVQPQLFDKYKKDQYKV